MKKLMYLLSVIGLTLCMSFSVSALTTFTPSVVQTGGTVASATITTASGTTVSLKIVSSGLENESDPAIQLSSLADILNGNSGLSASADLLVQTVYKAVTSTSSTSEFLSKLSTKAKSAFEKAVGSNVDKYKALTMFDISINDAAKELLAQGGSVDIDLEIAGVTTSNNPIAFHMTGNPASTDNSEVVDGEVLPSKVKQNGVLTVTLTSFSPIVVFVEDAADASGSTAAGSTSSTGASSSSSSNVTTSASTGGNVYFMSGVVALAVAAGLGIYTLATRKPEED